MRKGLDIFKYSSVPVIPGTPLYTSMLVKLTRLMAAGFKVKTFNGFVYGEHNFVDVLAKIREVTVYSREKEVIVNWF